MDFRDCYNSQMAVNKAKRNMKDEKKVNVPPPRAPRAPMEYQLPTIPTYRRPLWF